MKISLQEAFQALGVNQSTLYRWLDRAGIEPEHDSVDTRKKLLSLSQLHTIAEAHGKHLPMKYRVSAYDMHTMSEQDKLAELERRLARLEQAVELLTSLVSKNSAVVKQLKPPQPQDNAKATVPDEQSSSLPGDLELLAHFAKRHSKDGAPPTTVKRFAEDVGAPKDARGRWIADERVKSLFFKRFSERKWFQERECCPHNPS